MRSLVTELNLQSNARINLPAFGSQRSHQILAVNIDFVIAIIKMIQADSVKGTAENTACYILKGYQRIFIMVGAVDIRKIQIVQMQLLQRQRTINHRFFQAAGHLTCYRHRILNIFHAQRIRNNIIQADVNIHLLLTMQVALTVNIQSLACDTAAVASCRQMQLQLLMLMYLRRSVHVIQNKMALFIFCRQHRIMQNQLNIRQSALNLQMALFHRHLVQQNFFLRRLFILQDIQAHFIIKAKMNISIVQLNLLHRINACYAQYDVLRLYFDASLRHIHQAFVLRRIPGKVFKIYITPDIGTQLLGRHRACQHLLLCHIIIKKLRRMTACTLRQKEIDNAAHSQQADYYHYQMNFR